MLRTQTLLALALVTIVGCATDSLDVGDEPIASEITNNGGSDGIRELPQDDDITHVGASDSGSQGGSDVGTGGSDDNQGGSDNLAQGGAAGSDHQGGSPPDGSTQGGSSGNVGGSNQGGSAGIGGSEQGQGGSLEQGGSDQGGSDQGGSAGVGGSDEGQGGSDQGGAGGSDQGGTGGSDVEPTPCEPESMECFGTTLRICNDPALGFETIECEATPDSGPNCAVGRGCYGECVNGEIRCSTGGDAQTCVDGSWTTTEVCAFECSNGACEGSCEPGTTRCLGTNTQECGEDYLWESPAACPTNPNATTTCSGEGVCGLTPIACMPETADCDGNWSCETNLTSVDSCGSCGTVCPSAPNATRTCTDMVCGLTPIPCSSGTADCDGNWSCETPTSNNPLNCGGCGISCYGGSCNAGQCDFDFEVVTEFGGTNADSPRDMVTDATHIYWLTADKLRRAPKNGSADFETLAAISTPAAPKYNGLIVNGGVLYWATIEGVFKMPASGGTPVQLIDSTGGGQVHYAPTVRSMTLSDGKLYWNDSQVHSNATLCSVPPIVTNAQALNCNAYKVVQFYTLNLATNALTSWTTNQYEYSPILGVVGNDVIVAQFHYNTTLERQTMRIVALNAATGSFSRILLDAVDGSALQNEVGQVAFTADAMVYTMTLEIGHSSLGYVTLSGPSTIHVKNAYGLGFAADTTHAYYSDSGGRVYQVALSGGATDQLFGSSFMTPEISMDSTHVYWSVAVSATGERAILRAAK